MEAARVRAAATERRLEGAQVALLGTLLVLAVAVTANFAGLYELPSLSITRGGGRMSAFATGLLAAFVATPCTGPFMAAALGAALLLPWSQALLLFGESDEGVKPEA